MTPDDPNTPKPPPRKSLGPSILPSAAAGAIDPVCGMSVDPNAGKPEGQLAA